MKTAILAVAAALTMAVPTPDLGPVTQGAALHADQGRHLGHYKKHRKWQRERAREQRRYYAQQDRAYERQLSRNDRIWRGDDGRYRCRRADGTAGLVIGGALGAIAGSEVAGRQNRTIGAIIGAVGGGLLGRQIDRGGLRCR